jgi:hypothetical protein
VPAVLDLEFRPLPAGKMSEEVLIRARATSIRPAAYVRLDFGNKKPLEFTQYTPLLQARAGLDKEDPLSADDLLDESQDVLEEPGKAYTYLWLKPGIWSPAVPIQLLGAAPVIRVLGMNPGKVDKRRGASAHENVPAAITNVTVEFEILYRGKSLKTFSERATEGNIILIRLGLRHLFDRDGQSRPPGPEFLAESQGIEEYARQRADALEALPWAKGPLPKRYIFMTCCDSKAILNAHIYDEEYRTIRQLGVNGLFYSFRPQVEDAVRRGEGLAAAFSRARGDNQNLPGAQSQYILPEASPGNANVPPGAGCPHHPVNADLAAKTRAGVAAIMEKIRQTPYDEYWFQTISEIGCVYDRAPERKAHMGSCPYCREAFREFVRSFGLTPADFGAADWEAIRPTWGYFAKTFEEQKKEQDAAEAARQAKLEKEAAAASANRSSGSSKNRDEADALLATMGETPGDDRDHEDKDDETAGQPPIPLPPHGLALLRYYSARFINESSAKVFAPLRQAFVEENAKKRRALAEGRTDSPEARQPFVYSFALRGNSFLMGGHSLDFFDWYRHADSAFMYETSNRDPRVWGWDSYLCDVGRIHQDKLGTAFGLMIKPSRGAVVQRTLTAVARKVRAIYWYTYGPDYVHPDTFANPGRLPTLSLMSRTVHMLGEAEDVIYDADWAAPAEVAVARACRLPDSNASWENGKWIYQALAHAHIPVDALDDGYLLSEDLSRYKVIYLSGSGWRRDLAAKLRTWVEAGGTLVTSAGGLALDEAARPLAPLQPLLGLKTRTPVDTWGGVRRYGATALAPIAREKTAPAGATVSGKPPFAGSLTLAVGREILEPDAGTEVLATFADGGAAVTRRTTGKGAVYVIGFYPGLEYAAEVINQNPYNMAEAFRDGPRSYVVAPALAAGVTPPVAVSHPLIEAVLLKHPASGKQAVLLMNWAYRTGDEQRSSLVPAENVTVTVRNPAGAAKARSLWRREPLSAGLKDAALVLTLPSVEEGDILLLE